MGRRVQVAPAAVRAAFRRGVALYDAGHGGKGLRPETVAWARKLAAGSAVTVAKARKMKAWFARHGVAVAESKRRADSTSPAAVAWLLWGGNPSVPYRRSGWRDPVAAWIKRVLAVKQRNPSWKRTLPWLVLLPLIPP